jgi:hypothetical protein
MRLLLVPVIAFALSSCWVGTDLYAPPDARPVIPPGVYKATARDEPAHVYRISMLPNGMTQFDGSDENDVYGLAPLRTDGITFVAWEDVKPDSAVPAAPGDPNQNYALVVRQADGAFFIYLPTCSDDQAETVRKLGATIKPGTVATCVFPTRPILQEALLLLRRDDKAAIKLTPVR